MQSTQIQHVAIIPDGNRRWAKGKGIPEYLAHSNAGSFERFSSFLAAAEKKGIQFLSIWGFSTENWNRSLSLIHI